MDSCKKLLLGVVATLSLFATATPVFAADASSLQYMSQAGKTSQVSHVDYTTNVSKSTSATQATQKATTSYTTQATQALKYGWNVIDGNPNSIKFQKADKTLAVGWSNADGNWRYFDSNNNMVRSKWIQDGSAWYYLKADGVMAKNMNVDGYHVNASGAWDSNAVSGALNYVGALVATTGGNTTLLTASDFEAKVASGVLKAKVEYFSSVGGSTSGANMGSLSFYLTK